MSDIKAAFGTSNQTITITLNALAASTSYVGRQSTAVDNSSNKFLDALVSMGVYSSASALANDKAIYVFAYATVDGGSNYTDYIAGTDGSVTLTNPLNVPLLGVVNIPSSGVTYQGGPWSVASCFGGVLPEKWGIVVINNTGQALQSSFNFAKYQGIYATAT